MNKLTFAQYRAICNFINGLRKLNVNAYYKHDLSDFDETSYERTTTSIKRAIWLFDELQSSMHDAYNSMHRY